MAYIITFFLSKISTKQHRYARELHTIPHKHCILFKHTFIHFDCVCYYTFSYPHHTLCLNWYLTNTILTFQNVTSVIESNVELSYQMASIPAKANTSVMVKSIGCSTANALLHTQTDT